jgi:hypothetical protein
MVTHRCAAKTAAAQGKTHPGRLVVQASRLHMHAGRVHHNRLLSFGANVLYGVVGR